MGSLGITTEAIVGVAVSVGIIVCGPPIGGEFDGLVGVIDTRTVGVDFGNFVGVGVLVGIGVLVRMTTLVGLIFEIAIGVGEDNTGVVMGRL